LEDDMAIASRTARTTWQGSLARGAGEVSGDSGALAALPVTWAARTEEPGGKTSPEELAAAAHSSCFSMALSLRLGENKLEVTRLEVSSTVTLDEVDGLPTVTTAAIEVTGTVDGVDAAKFQEIVDEAAALCPISRLFAGAKIEVTATLAAG
jgi:osmotically inducible protein OsmC